MSDTLKRQLFNIELFNPKLTVFPQQVSKEKFDEYTFKSQPESREPAIGLRLPVPTNKARLIEHYG
jgi:hypothetical protein